MIKESVLTLQEAADILHVKDVRTIRAWGRQGRFLLIGDRNMLVNVESLQAYLRGESEWHAQRSQPRNDPGANLALARFATGKAAKSRGKQSSKSKGTPQGQKVFNPNRTRARG